MEGDNRRECSACSRPRRKRRYPLSAKATATFKGGSDARASIAHTYALMRRHDAARSVLAQLEEHARHAYVPPHDMHGINGTPGASEYVNHVTVTLHKEHHMRRYYDWELNFMQTATGKHVLLWQAS